MTDHIKHAEVAASGIGTAVIKTAPPAAVATLNVLGQPLPTWVQVATLVWLILQMAGWIYDRFFKDRIKVEDDEQL